MEVLTRKRLSDGTEIFTIKGTKGKEDFIVKATFPSGRSITPKHAHFVIDLYGKLCQNRELGKMVFELIKRVYEGRAAEEVLQGLREEDENRLANSVGYSIEYILYCLELIFKQEEINYPQPRYKGKRLAFEMLEDVVNGMHPVEAMKKAQLRI
jgi:hypothetical protein